MKRMQKCAHCGKNFSSSMRLCPFCGNEKQTTPGNEEVVCPCCGVRLDHQGYRGNDIDICPQCSGIWLDYSEFRFLTSERDVYRDDAVPNDYVRKPLSARKEYIACPSCGKLMIRSNFKKISGVIIDVCRDHGVWLDAGELAQIRSFIANGGLDASQDREIEENREAVKSLDTRLSDVEFMQKLLHHWKFKRWMFS